MQKLLSKPFNRLIDVILCCDKKFGIAKSNIIPWKIKEDIQFFRQKTSEVGLPGIQNVVIMGRKTYQSIGKPLPDRLNFVISSGFTTSQTDINTPKIFKNMDDCFSHIKTINTNKIFIIGGATLYDWIFSNPLLIDNVYLSMVDKDYGCDTIVKQFSFNDYKVENMVSMDVQDSSIDEQKESQKVRISFYKLKPNNAELAYLRLAKEILIDGKEQMTRNGLTTYLFGRQISFNLERFPLITTKHTPFRLIFEELLFFLKGRTNTKELEAKKVFIWKKNTTKEFLEKRKLPYSEGQMGPLYGHVFKFYCGFYDVKSGVSSGGFDQFEFLLNQILDECKKQEGDRRLLMTSYNPIDAQKSVLYPCHGLIIQFDVSSDNMTNLTQDEHKNNKTTKKFKLNCAYYQRSCDYFLGLPFNIASYALLTHIICNIVNTRANVKTDSKTNVDFYLDVGTLTISFGNVHIYEKHLTQVHEMLSRKPFEFPTLTINKKIKNVEELAFEDVSIHNYKAHPKIDAEMIA
jgi:thymidylate synthase/dihydrofolate reductase